jgi:hypothetical protein
MDTINESNKKFYSFRKVIASLTIFIVFGFFCEIFAQSLLKGNPYILNYNSADHHANPFSYSIIQSRSGLVYVGNLWGLIEFDGYWWRRIRIKQASSGVSLAEDKNGTIFVGGRGEFGYLEPDNTGSLIYKSLIDLLPEKDKQFSDVWRTYCINGKVFFASFEKIFIYNYKTIKTLTPKIKFDYLHLCNNVFYVKEANSGLRNIRNDSLIALENGNNITDYPITDIAPFGKNEILISGLHSGISNYDETTLKPINKNITSGFINNQVSCVSAIPGQSFIIGTKSTGIFVLDKNALFSSHLDKTNGLAGNNINDIFVNPSGEVWIALKNGISYIKSQQYFQFISENMGVLGLPYASLIKDKYLYLGTSEGLFYRNESNNIQNNNIEFKQINKCKGQIWAIDNVFGDVLCGHEDGIYQLIGQEAHKIANIGAWAFLPLKNTRMAIAGTYEGLLLLEKKGNNWTFVSRIKDFSPPIRYVCQDDIGDLWLSDCTKGIYRLRLNSEMNGIADSKLFNVKSGLPSDSDNKIFKINNEIIISTKTIVFWYNKKKDIVEPHPAWKVINESIRHVDRIIPMNSNKLWIIYDNGNIAQLKKDASGLYSVNKLFTKFYEKLVGSFEHLRMVDNNSFILSTIEGYVIYNDSIHNSNIVSSANNFKVYIRKVEVNGPKPYIIWGGHYLKNTPSNSTSNIILKNTENSLQFSYSSSNYEDIKSTLFNYTLNYNGKPNEWGEWSTNNKKEYTNLSYGNYSFTVKAKNTYGVISNESTFKFTILPPWYLTLWAKSIAGLLSLTLMCFIIVFVRYRFKLQSNKLEREKQMKLLAQKKQHEEQILRNEKEIVQLQNEKLKVELAANEQKELLRKQEEAMKEKQFQSEKEILSLQSQNLEREMCFKNNELASMAIQMAHKNDILIELRNKIEKEFKKIPDPNTKGALRQIDELIDNELKFDDDWKQFKDHFDSVHNDFIQRLMERHPTLKLPSLKLCSYLLMQLSNKQIAALMNTSETTVAKSRFRLREKLNLKEGEKVIDYLKQI